jgi:glutaminase
MEAGTTEDMVCNEGRGVVVEYTEHYRFKKPGYEDFADIEDINYALEQLDGKFYEQESKIDKAVAITGELVVVKQTTQEMKAQIETYTQQIQKNTNNLAVSMSDIAKLTFQLQLKDLIDSSDMTLVAVDQIDSTDSVVITSGTYADKKVYI